MRKLIRWRVVTTNCRLSPPLEVVAEGESETLTTAEEKAAELRATVLGPEMGVAVEWLYDVYGYRWLRHYYILTESQTELLAEVERRERVERSEAHSKSVEAKELKKKKDRKFNAARRFEEKQAKREEMRERLERERRAAEKNT